MAMVFVGVAMNGKNHPRNSAPKEDNNTAAKRTYYKVFHY
jgi:hypothetical protein